MDDLIKELALKRLKDKIRQGLLLSHDFVLKERPGAKTIDNRYRWCSLCNNWAWALGLTCGYKYDEALKQELEVLMSHKKESK